MGFVGVAEMPGSGDMVCRDGISPGERLSGAFTAASRKASMDCVS